MEISVVIPTRNRAVFLERCLASLCAQTLDPARYEICVADNGSTDNTRQIAASFIARYPHHNIIVADEPQTGVARARNRGLGLTQAPLVAFGDDDATMPPDWLELYLARFGSLDQNVAVIGGEVIPEWQAPPPAWLTKRMLGILSAASEIGDRPRFVEPPQNLFEGNCCYRRAALVDAGGFPVELGRVGDCLTSGEGFVNMLIRQRGGLLYFDPSITIRHTIHADRLRPAWFRRRIFWQGVSGYAAHHYYERHGLAVVNAVQLKLPLDAKDWSFIEHDSAEGLEESLDRFESLGFVLAMSGIVRAATSGNDAVNPGESKAAALRRHSFWQGVAEYAAGKAASNAELPLDPADWAFVNDASVPSSENHLAKLYALGFVLAKGGIINQ